MNLIHLAEDRYTWRMVLSLTINLCVPQKAGNFFASELPISFTGNTP